MLLDAEVHDDGYQVNDLQMSQDRTYFITAGKDKQAKVSKSSASFSCVVTDDTSSL